MRKIHRGQKGITGLETAIILIAFVVVAAVFAYTVLSAGLFASQKSSESVYSGLKETQSTLEPNGALILKRGTTYVDEMTFSLMLAMNGEPVDFTEPPNNVVVLCYLDKYQRKDDLVWALTKLGGSDNDNLLENDEKFQVTISNLETGANALNPSLDSSTKFVLELKPPIGATLVMERTTPRALDPVMTLH